MSTQNSASAGRRSLRTVVTLAASGAVLGLLGAGTASAHESEEPTSGGPLGAVQASTGAVLHHVEKYHLADPTWEVRSLLTSPQQNARIHMAMLDEATDPIISLLP